MNRIAMVVAAALLVAGTAVAAESADREGPPGHAKQRQLPPGLQKKLERGGELPPGWQKKVQRGEVIDAELYALGKPVPRTIADRLPAPDQAGTQDVVIENKVIRVLDATRTILDVFDIE